MQRAAKSLHELFRARAQCWHLSSVRHLATVAPSSVPHTVTTHSASIRLRDYQEDCIQSVLSYFEKGGKRAGISLATGSGKTVSSLVF